MSQSSTTWAERRGEQLDKLRVEAELRKNKRCTCGEILTNDEVGEQCRCCGTEAEDMIFQSLLGTPSSEYIH
jgi:hypothetical protein